MPQPVSPHIEPNQTLNDDISETDTSPHAASNVLGTDFAQQFNTKFDQIFSEINDLRAERARARSFDVQLSLTGIFYIILGLGILYYASANMGASHAALSFVLVVLGLALVLYGTGTQSAGDLKSDATTAARYNVYIAGGAGVLAFCIAMGIVYKHEDMKQAFQIERQYLIVKVQPTDDGQSRLDNYLAHASIEGMSIPLARRGDNLMVYVPFVLTDTSATVNISLERSGASAATSPLRPTMNKTFLVNLALRRVADSGYDFPVYAEIQRVDLRANKVALEELGKSGGGAAAPLNSPVAPPVIFDIKPEES
jgi:uncharacterized protein YjeT (DUF2065 family)